METIQIKIEENLKKEMKRLAIANGFSNNNGEANLSQMIKTDYSQRINRLKNILVNPDEFKYEFVPNMIAMFNELIENQADITNSMESENYDEAWLEMLKYIQEFILTNQDSLLACYLKWTQIKNEL